MTPADKEIVAEYMGWSFDDDANLYFYTNKELDLCIAHYDLNDTSLCVSRMVEKRQWYGFWLEAEDILRKDETASYNNCNETEGSLLCRWLFNADNFFQAMAAWLRSK